MNFLKTPASKNAGSERFPSAFYFFTLFLGICALSLISIPFTDFSSLDLSSKGFVSESQAAETGPSNPILDFASSTADRHSFIGSRTDHILLIVLVLLALILSKKQAETSPTPQRILQLICIYLGLRYLYWRGFYTLNTQDTFSAAISIVLYLAEIYGFIAVVLFYFQVSKPINPTPQSPQKGELPTVDIFITIYNEPLDILYRTAVACLAIDYPVDRRRIYVLDDGHRDEVKRATERLGCNYLSRSNNDHAKAGNLNHGLANSSGDFIVILDCDHVPVQTFLKETIGFFKDPKVAFVQTPHFFYNPDVFQKNLRLECEIANEQDLFFRIIQPGRHGHNASFYAGSGGIFRRSALRRDQRISGQNPDGRSPYQHGAPLQKDIIPFT